MPLFRTQDVLHDQFFNSLGDLCYHHVSSSHICIVSRSILVRSCVASVSLYFKCLFLCHDSWLLSFQNKKFPLSFQCVLLCTLLPITICLKLFFLSLPGGKWLNILYVPFVFILVSSYLMKFFFHFLLIPIGIGYTFY